MLSRIAPCFRSTNFQLAVLLGSLSLVGAAVWPQQSTPAAPAGAPPTAIPIPDDDQGGNGGGPRSSCPGDVNLSGGVDISDLAQLLAHFGMTSGAIWTDGDMDGDGDVDLQDLAILLANFGAICPGMPGIDLDVDSDNTNGTEPPDRSPGEDSIEDTAGQPGKLILVNDDDDNFNGIPDKDEDGTITQEQDDLVPLVLEIQSGSPSITTVAYKLTYPTNRMRIWRTHPRGVLATDVIESGVQQSYSVPGGPITIWIEGRSASTSVGGAIITAVADVNGDGNFELSDAVKTTVVSVSFGVTHGVLGANIPITIAPAVAEMAFDATTTATWNGLFVGTVTGTSSPFEVDYSSAQFRETSSIASSVVLGDGTISSGNPVNIGLDGRIDGAFSIHFSTLTARKSIRFVVDRSFTFVAGAGGAGSEIQPIRIVDPSGPNWGQGITLETAVLNHHLLAILVERNSVTTAASPNSIRVELVSRNQAGTELGRLSMPVFREIRTDFGANRYVYYSDWLRPIVFVSTAVNPAQHPTLYVLRADSNGTVFAVVNDNP